MSTQEAPRPVLPAVTALAPPQLPSPSRPGWFAESIALLPATVARRLSPQVAGWIAIGLVSIGLELALLALLYDMLDWPLWLVSAAVKESILVGRFLVLDRWTFHHPTPSLGRFGRFHAACLGALAASWAVLNALVALGVPYPVATLLGTAGSFAWSLSSNFRWVWGRNSRPRQELRPRPAAETAHAQRAPGA